MLIINFSKKGREERGRESEKKEMKYLSGGSSTTMAHTNGREVGVGVGRVGQHSGT